MVPWERRRVLATLLIVFGICRRVDEVGVIGAETAVGQDHRCDALLDAIAARAVAGSDDLSAFGDFGQDETQGAQNNAKPTRDCH